MFSNVECSEFSKTIISLSPLMKNHLHNVIKHFDSVIDSPYRCSQIESFEDLVAVLVKREHLDPLNKITWDQLLKVCHQYGVVPPVTHQTLPDLAVEYLSTRIGKFSWTNFARALRLRNCDIDKIEIEHEKDHPACVKEVLNIYTEKMPWICDKEELTEKIIEALVIINRSGLISDFKKIMASSKI